LIATSESAKFPHPFPEDFYSTYFITQLPFYASIQDGLVKRVHAGR
jgi:hypothetical protein